MESIKPLLAKIEKSHAEKVTVVKALRKEQAILKKLGIDYGTPAFKNDKYLRIVRPAVGDKPREFEYVGADPAKQQAAYDALERGKQYDALGAEIEEIERLLYSVESSLGNVVNII